MKELLLFQVGTLHYGIDLPLVKGIESAKPIVAEWTEDSNQLTREVDGMQMPLYDLFSIFEGKISSRDWKNEKLILVETEEYTMGLIVSRVNQVVPSDNDSVKPLSPIFGGSTLSCFSGVVSHDDTLILLLKPEGIAQILPKTVETQKSNEAADCTDASPEIEEIITLTNEVPYISDYGSMSPNACRTPDSDIYQSKQATVDEKLVPLVAEIHKAEMGPATLGESGIDQESLGKSASFSTNHLQADRDASQQLETYVSQTVSSSKTEEPPAAVDMDEKSRVPVEDFSNQPSVDFTHIERVVADMLPEKQLEKKVERETIKTIQKSKLTESVRGHIQADHGKFSSTKG